MITPEAARRLAGAWFEAWNRHDLESILAHYAEDVELSSPLVARILGIADATVRGKTALRAYFARALAAFPELRFEPIEVAAGVCSVVLVYRSVNGLLAAETLIVGDDGRIVRVLAHYAEMPGARS